ncbi:MAG: IS110 family transposase [Alkalibacterium sp.]|nr:IS110 family transposase [Alkalibacterium sp.]
MKLFVGLDVSKATLDACFLSRADDSNVILLQKSVANSDTGARKIKEQILKFHEELEFTKIVIGMEATGQYSMHPSLFFSNDPDLQLLNAQTIVENPRVIHRFSKVWTEEKNDKLDAQLIAEFLSTGKYSDAQPREEKFVALLRLTRSRYQLIRQLTEAQQHYVENLYYKCNTLTTELDEENISTSVFSSTMIQLMAGDTDIADLRSMKVADLAAMLQSFGRGRFKDPIQLAKAIRKSVNDSYRLGKVAQDSIDINISVQMRVIRALQQEIKTVEKAIENIMETIDIAQSLLSIPGIGPVYAAGIIAEIGQIERFDHESKLAKYAGLYWPKHQSGQFQKENTAMSKSGNRYLRYYLVQAANSVRRYIPEYKDYYDKKYNEVPKTQHKRALVLTARKLVRLVFALLSNHQLYIARSEAIES